MLPENQKRPSRFLGQPGLTASFRYCISKHLLLKLHLLGPVFTARHGFLKVPALTTRFRFS